MQITKHPIKDIEETANISSKAWQPVNVATYFAMQSNVLDFLSSRDQNLPGLNTISVNVSKWST